MLILGIQGSPRAKGNTEWMLESFMEEAFHFGKSHEVLIPSKMDIKPCRGCRLCEEKGYCAIDNDDMTRVVYPLLRKADLVVMASPVFFYNVPSQLKALIDRSQTLWARKYIMKLEDPASRWRKGFFLCLGATKGKNLFEGPGLTAKYFFDGISADYAGILGYRQIEKPGDFAKHPDADREVREKARELIRPYMNRKKIVFVCRENACRSQMSAAFARMYGGDRLEVFSGGSEPASMVNPLMQEVMSEKGVDMAFKKPVSLEEAIGEMDMNYGVTMGCEVACPVLPGAEIIEWDLTDPAGKPIEVMREMRDEIEGKVRDLVEQIG